MPGSLSVNGCSVPLDGCAAHMTLLDLLRARGLTGAKESCAEGECGSCTVAMVVPRGSTSAFEPLNSCLLFVPAAAGREFYTVEGLASRGELAPVQEVLSKAGASQCGYCTPGFVMSLFAEQYRPGRTGPCDPDALSGNLCRCTGYRPIRDAALALGPAPAGPLRDRLSQPAQPLAPFDYEHEGIRFSRPTSLAGCLALSARHPAARFTAGLTDLAVAANVRHTRFPHLISLEAVAELQTFSQDTNEVRIGAALSLARIGQLWHTAPKAFEDWSTLFASPLIRNRATLGGSLGTASPIGDAAPLLLALDASLLIHGPLGQRRVPVASFFTGFRQTVLQPAELIETILIPKPLPAFTRFYKVSKRRTDDISTVAAGFSITTGTRNRIAACHIAFGGVAPVPFYANSAAEAVLGEPWDASAVSRIQHELDRTLRPISDHRGSAAYRLALTKSLLEKFFVEWQESAG